VLVPGCVSSCPSEQGVHAVHEAAFAVVLKVPLAQAAHMRVEDELPAMETYCPAAQLVQGMHAAAFSPVL
jgi:hypothetical protein